MFIRTDGILAWHFGGIFFSDSCLTSSLTTQKVSPMRVCVCVSEGVKGESDKVRGFKSQSTVLWLLTSITSERSKVLIPPL